MPPSRQALYRLYDSADNLLYIGRSAHPETAIRAHTRRTYGWQVTIARHTIEWYPRQTMCRDAATDAHLQERPLHPDPTLDLRPTVARPVYVYQLYDATGTLLYVGQSYRPGQRLTEHRVRFPELASVRIDRYENREEASAAEVHAILTKNPLHNIRAVGSVEQRFPRSPWGAAQDIIARFRSGEITVRTMFNDLLLYPDITPRRAAHLLGFNDGSPFSRRRKAEREGTVDLMLQINNLNPDATWRDMPATWREDHAA